MSYEPLHHKYRPQTFAELVGQEAIATTLTNALRQQKIAPAYLFTGARGTGKTSSARILAKSLNCLTSETPTAQPCGKCEACRMIAKGAALDVIEIDAASNTGVDNIRELIERSQFAPVQCRYKVYVVDECLTGDSLVLTQDGLTRIDDPTLQGKTVLSYNDISGAWEYKPVVRWLDQGERATFIIKTANREIQCTGNHLIRTEQGWIPAKDVTAGMKILSPANVDAVHRSTCLGQMGECADLPEGICSKAISTDKKPTIWNSSLVRLNRPAHFALVAKFLLTGFLRSLQKDWLGGTWTTVHFASAQKEVHRSSSIQKATLFKKTTSWLNGLPKWATQLKQDFIREQATAKHIFTSGWVQDLPESGYQTYSSTQFPQWRTNLETVESVGLGGFERVYDIEVEDNHNFVANGLLVHNCHMLSTAAFNALLKTLEEPPDRVVFILATTDPQRVLPTIISRCQRFDFRRIPLEAMVTHLAKIAQNEAIEITPEAVQLVAQISQGGLRDAEALLDQLSLLEGAITLERVWDLVGAVPEQDLFELVQAIAQDNATTVLDRARHLMDRGREPLIVLQNLASFYRDLLIAKASPDRQDLVAITPFTWKALCEFVQNLETGMILRGQQHLREAEIQVRNTAQPRLWLEVTLMGLLPSAIGSRETREGGRGKAAEGRAMPLGSHQDRSSVIANQGMGTGRQVRSTAPQPESCLERGEKAPERVTEAIAKVTPVTEELTEDLAATKNDYRTIEDHPVEELVTASGAVVSPQSQGSAQNLAQNCQYSEQDLERIWHEVLEQIQFRGTQVLLQQQGSLLFFDGQEARVGIKSQPLFKMAREKLSTIEAAFEAVYRRKVRISLEVTSAIETQMTLTEPSRTTGKLPGSEPMPRSQSSRAGQKPSVKESSGSLNSGAAPKESPSKDSQPAFPAQSPVPFPSPTSLEATSEPNVSTTPSIPWQEDDEVSEAAKSLAQFFNGQIVSLDNDLPVSRLEDATLELSESETEESDDDVPF